MERQLPDGDWSSSGRVNSCKVPPMVGCSPWGKRPTLAYREFQMYSEMV